MKKVVLDLAVSLDGFIEGPDGETDWCIMDEDMNFEGFLDSIDTIFYGRVSYDAWGNFQAGEDGPGKEMWAAIHTKNKFVFSRQQTEGGGATFINRDIPEAVAAIKRKAGKNIWLYGGAGLIRTFIHHNLVDIYRISVHPVALGSGKPLFQQLENRVNLRLLQTNTFRSGVVQLIYEQI